jgi:hypothetical protein
MSIISILWSDVSPYVEVFCLLGLDMSIEAPFPAISLAHRHGNAIAFGFGCGNF